MTACDGPLWIYLQDAWLGFLRARDSLTVRLGILVACKNKISIVTPLKVTKSDSTIGFSVVDLVEKRSGLWIFFLIGAFFDVWIQKVGCLYLNSASVTILILFLQATNQALMLSQEYISEIDRNPPESWPLTTVRFYGPSYFILKIIIFSH